MPNLYPNAEGTNGRFLTRWQDGKAACPACGARTGVFRVWEGQGEAETTQQHRCPCGKIWWLGPDPEHSDPAE